MIYLKKQEFFDYISKGDLISRADDGNLSFKEGVGCQGFDFSNLLFSEELLTDEDYLKRGDSVEREMIKELLYLLKDIKEFPLTVATTRKGWVDKSFLELSKDGAFSKDELKIFDEIMTSGNSESAIEIEEDEIEFGINLIYPQIVLRENPCVVLGEGFITLSNITDNEEINFNTRSVPIYMKARDIMKCKDGSLPFELVWNESGIA